MKMRFTWYAGVSAVLAGGVVVSAFHQRANFYSAMVHLSQSSLSLMVLVNLIFVVYGSAIYGLQRLCFGPLRPVEIEQLYEKAWFAVTETCLAMTIFREEVGAFFLVMFTALVTGKVWGWIGEGRVEVLEQQPPANPRLFHTRLSISLLLSIIYDTWLLSYATNTVVQQARPTMMVMFLFEFAVLTITSLHTGIRYLISLAEQRVIKTQTQQRLADARQRIRQRRAEMIAAREAGTADSDEELPDEGDVEEMDIEVPGWESKGQWVLTLDLVADFIKLGIYTAFFCVLFTFYGLPIHIIRDWFMTTRSFLKRLSALIRYRQALKDMDQYADATPEDLERENTCIICREEMRPWDPADNTQVERTRAKKLPCGHILHFGCLKSWLERQQVCPTCRRPVAREGAEQPARNGDAMVFRLGLNIAGGQNRPAQQPAGQGPAGQVAPAPNNQENQNQNPNRAVRMFNLGPLRLGIAQGGINDLQEMAQQMALPDGQAPPAPQPAAPQVNDAASLEQIRAQLLDVGQRVQQEMLALQNAAHELTALNFVVNELGRLRQLQQAQQGQQAQQPGQPPSAPYQGPGAPAGGPAPPAPLGQLPLPPLPPQWPGQFPPGVVPGAAAMFPGFVPRPPAAFTRHGGASYGTAIPAGSPDLPEGVVIPPGWSLLPLQRLDGGPPVEAVNPQASQTQHRARTTTAQTEQPDHRIPRNVAPVAEMAISPPRNVAPVAEMAISPPRNVAPVAEMAISPPRSVSTEDDQPASPRPVAPNWGGSAQFLVPTTQDEVGESSEGPSHSEHQDHGSSEGSRPRGVTVEEASDDEDEV
ncbi:ERAD-associated E3 ubiquitin-protein ligase HRD1 [Echria macrotheca]|uniref:RING-type E3 ubiquitin transferase n=1 Tax=Echria macrotheca TaxID=438768 RepID=A0AAJ0FBA7_9PEZI|nr:ERAD-associated E3 ubiquitin-protein ligase HRD1 [Echria macrotheca]